MVTYSVWIGAIVSTATAAALATWYAPVEAEGGLVPKLFYVHAPAAMVMFVACFLSFVGGLAYLWQRKSSWEALVVGGAELAAFSSSLVLVTGMLWGRLAWGEWWTWSPRLTFSLVLWLLYVVFLVARPMVATTERRALLSAAYAVIAFLDVPLVYLSVKLLPDIHPAQITLVPAMRVTLYASIVASAFLSGVFLLAACIRRPPADAPLPPGVSVA